MRRNKVLTTLAAVSMSAMMAVSAAPAVTVMAANETTEVAPNVGIDNEYTMTQTFGEKPYLVLNGTTKTQDYTLISAIANGKHYYSADDLADLSAGTVVSDISVQYKKETLNGDTIKSYKVEKANPVINLTQNDYDVTEQGNAYNPKATSSQVSSFTYSLEKQDDKTGAFVPYSSGKTPQSNGTYRVTAHFAGNGNYNAKDVQKTFEVSGYTTDSALGITVTNSTYLENPTFTVPPYEDRELNVTIYPHNKEQALNNKGDVVTVDRTEDVSYTGKIKNGKLTDLNTSVTFKNEAGKDVTKNVLPVGTYTFVIEANANPEKAAATQTVENVTVSKKAIDGIQLSKTAELFNDTAKTPAATARAYVNAYNDDTKKVEKLYIDSDDVDITVKNVAKNADGNYYVTDAGSYTVTATAKPDTTSIVETIKGNPTTTKNNPELYKLRNFSGSAEAVYTITGNLPQSINWAGDFTKPYDGKAIDVKATGRTGTAKLTYTDANGNALTSAPVNAGTYYVTATAAADKNYGEATSTKKIVITKREVSLYSFLVKDPEYDGDAQIPELVDDRALAKDDQKTVFHLVKGKDYTVVAAKDDDATSVGKHKATLKLAGNFKGDDVEVNYDITPYTLDSNKLESLVSVDDAEPGKTPTVHVYARDGKEIPAADYKVSASNNSKIGTGSVNISGRKNTKSGIQNVKGSITLNYNVAKAATVEKTDLYRLYNKNTGEHFFTTNAGEKNNLVKVGWNFEGVSMQTVKDGGKPVYRLYNKNNGGEHLYTTSKGEANKLVSAGWAYEGVAFNAAKNGAEGAVKVYRVYNPNKIANNHHYTTSAGEKNKLVQAGWRDEGVVFYAYNAL